MIDNELHGDLMILVDNAKNRQETYRQMAKRSLVLAKDHPLFPPDIYTYEQAAEGILAGLLKDRFEWMIDDIKIYPTTSFPKRFDRGMKGREDDFHEERKVMIDCLVAHAIGQVNWTAMAKEILAGVEEEVSYQN